MSRPDLRSAVAATVADGVRWLLAAIGTAMGAPAPACTRRDDALDRAAAAASGHGGGRHGWTYTDAVQIANRWLCVIEDLDSVYLIEVAVHSGVARVLTQVRNPVGGGGRIVAPDAADRGTGPVGARANRYWWGGSARSWRPRAAQRRPPVGRP